jgi:tetratricopeptide (TPR) repeat protein
MTKPNAPGLSPSKAPRARTSGGASWRHFVVVVVALGLGLAVGAAVSLLAPHGSLFAPERARRALLLDTAAGLASAAAIADDGDPNLAGVGALAHLLLWRDRGAVDAERVAAERLLQAALPSTRTSPEALYARAVLSTLPPAEHPVVDAALDDDLKRAPDDDAWVHLARALRVEDPDRRRELERAAFACAPNPHATWMLARWLLENDDVTGARAALDRLFRQAPEHAGGIMTSVVVGARGDALSPSAASGAATDDVAARRPSATKARPDETRANELLDRDLAPLDQDLLVFAIWFAQLVRGTGVDAALLARIPALAARSDRNAAQAIEMTLLDGDVDGASALVGGLTNGAARPALLVDAARVRLLKALPDDERRALIRTGGVADDKGRGGRGLYLDGVHLPLGRLAFQTAPLASISFGLPWTPRPDPTVFPERRLAALGSAAGPSETQSAEKLAVVEQLALAERALARGDVAGALALVEQARGKAPADPDVGLVGAAAHARQGERAKVKADLETLVVDDAAPETLLSAARIALDVDDLVTCRRALTTFSRSGLQSPLGAALLANLEARGGDTTAARAALGEAKRLGAGVDVLALRAKILVARNADLAEARAAADTLLQREPGGGDVVGAWLAEAQFRAGEQPRAEAALRAIVSAQPLLGEAHLFLARAIAFNPAQRKEAFERAMRAMDLIDRGPLLEEAKTLALSLKKR